MVLPPPPSRFLETICFSGHKVLFFMVTIEIQMSVPEIVGAELFVFFLGVWQTFVGNLDFVHWQFSRLTRILRRGERKETDDNLKQSIRYASSLVSWISSQSPRDVTRSERLRSGRRLGTRPDVRRVSLKCCILTTSSPVLRHIINNNHCNHIIRTMRCGRGFILD